MKDSKGSAIDWTMKPMAKLSLVSFALCVATACADSAAIVGVQPQGDDASGDGPSAPDGVSFGDGGPPDAIQPPQPTAGIYAIGYPLEQPVLYRYDAPTNVLTEVGPVLTGSCDLVVGLAIDSVGNGYVWCFSDASVEGFFKIDLATGAATLIASPTPNLGATVAAMSFVPKGTLDPQEDALVGYAYGYDYGYGGCCGQPASYVRIDEATGALTVINAEGLGPSTIQWPSGMVSVNGGGTFVTYPYNTTIDGVPCGVTLGPDCILEVDPKTGSVMRNYGRVPGFGAGVAAIAYWAGVVYGFGPNGNGGVGIAMYGVEWMGTTPVSTTINPKCPTCSGDGGLIDFSCASSSLSVPPLTADGGGPPIN